MASKNYIEETLELPAEMPLFNYNLNFKGLRNLIEQIQVRTNTNTDNLSQLSSSVDTKLPSTKFRELQKILNNNVALGLSSNKLADQIYEENQKKFEAQINRKQIHELQPIQQYGRKTKRITNIIQYLVNGVHQAKQKINQDDRKNEKMINQMFRRIDERVEAGLDSMNKNINLYFGETNKKIVDISTSVDANKRLSDASIQDIRHNLTKKISESELKATITGIEVKVKSELENQLRDDEIKRLATLNEYSTKLKEHIKDTEIKIKSMRNNIKDISDQVSKVLPIKSFEVQKHKIFEKLSQQRNKLDEVSRKSGEFVDFRKNSLENNERIRQNILGLQDDIKRLRDNGSNFKKMEDIGSILQSLDPHLICQLSSEVKLHEKEIGKMQKQIIYLQNELESAKNSTKKVPEVNSGQTSDMITKIIKQYMSNLDFEGRVKRAEKQLQDLSKKSDGVNELEKKIYMLGKQMDIGAIMKQIRKKADDDINRREHKIIDTKVEKLFDFYKQVRKDMEELSKRSHRNVKDMGDSVSLTTKKLHPPNCLSCTPKPKTQRNYSRPRFEMSLDQSLDQIKNSVYGKY